MLIDDIKNIICWDEKKLRKFGFTMAAFFAALFTFIVLFKHKTNLVLLTLSVILGLPAVIYPKLLAPFYVAWMSFATVLGWFMTRVILVILYYCVITPIGFVARCAGKDFLHLKFARERQTYWIAKDHFTEDNKQYEKQF